MSRRTVWVILVLLGGAVGLVVACVLAAKALTSGPGASALAQFLGFTSGGEYQEVVETLRESALDPALQRQGWRLREPADWGEDLPLSGLREGYRLRKGVPEILGQPRQAFERAMLIQEDNLWCVVEHSGDLDGYLEITTGTQALEFVRLLSGPRTFYLWKDLGFVELSIQASPPSKESRSDGGEGPNPVSASSLVEFLPGALTPEQAKALDFRPPEVRADAEEFRVTRFVAKREPGGSQVYRMTERVTRSGGYEILSAFKVEKNVDVWVPRVE